MIGFVKDQCSFINEAASKPASDYGAITAYSSQPHNRFSEGSIYFRRKPFYKLSDPSYWRWAAGELLNKFRLPMDLASPRIGYL